MLRSVCSDVVADIGVIIQQHGASPRVRMVLLILSNQARMLHLSTGPCVPSTSSSTTYARSGARLPLGSLEPGHPYFSALAYRVPRGRPTVIKAGAYACLPTIVQSLRGKNGLPAPNLYMSLQPSHV